MTEHKQIAGEVKEAGRVLGHGIAVLLGLLLLVIGAAMGVTLVLLPVGLMAAAAGLMLIVWGLYLKTQAPQRPRMKWKTCDPVFPSDPIEREG